MAERTRGDKRRVRDVMVTDVVTIEPSASLVTAARLMRDANIGMLPVVDDGHVVGVITDVVIPAHPDWPTEKAIVTMAQAQVGRLPVLDDDERLVGIVTLSSMAFRSRHKAVALEAAQEVSRRSARAA